MERWLSASSTVLLWAGFNTILASVLAGFTASGTVGGAGPAGALAFSIYAASTTIVFFIALVVWLARRRLRSLNEPPRPAAAVLLAASVAIAWTGLALGEWASITAAAVGVAALVFAFYPRTRPK